MKTVHQWVAMTAIYPPSEMFFQADSKQAKAEKRVVSICEELYVFTNTTLSDLRAAYTVLSNAVKRDISSMKQTYVQEICGALAFHIDNSVQALDTMHKKDPLLQAYYKQWACKSKDLKDEVKAVLIEAFPDVDKAQLLSEFQYWYCETKEKYNA